MTDLWYTFGAMIADPALFGVIAKLDPTFTRIKMVVKENDDPSYVRTAAGYLDANSTTGLRRAIRDYIAANCAQPAPVISLYTSAKLCQLWTTLKALQTAFQGANRAFVRAGGQKASSAALLTIMGACFLDGRLATSLRAGDQPLPGDTVPPTLEFGLHPASAEYKVLQAWLPDGDFDTAQATLMSADCWTTAPCLEEFAFYPEFKRAVN
jgi:hypothetical protein